MSYFEVTVPTQNGYIFSNARSNDVVIHTQNSNQRYLMGTTSNGVAEFQIDKGLITLNGNVTGCNDSFNATSFTCSGVTNLVGDTTLAGNLIFNNAIGMSRLRINQYTSNAPINLISTVVGLSNETNGMNLNTACNYIRFLGSNNMEMARFSNSNLYVASNISCSNLLTCGTLSKSGGSFDIPHPNPTMQAQGYHLRHCFVESPTRGDNIYRFLITTTTLDEVFTLELPDYFSYMNENPMCTISYQSPNDYSMCGACVSVDLKSVSGKCQKQGDYCLIVIGTRKDQIMIDYFDNTGGVEYKV